MTDDRGTHTPATAETTPSTVARLEEQLLGGPRELSLTQMADAVGTDVDRVRLYWHALGLPTAEPDAQAYTEADAVALRALLRAAELNEVSEDTAVSLVRSIGHTTDRLVVWQVEALAEHMAERYGLDDTSARLMVLDRLRHVAPLLEQQLVHAWRRQLAALAGRVSAEFGRARGRRTEDDELPLARAVGFADMVAFTSRTARLGSHELARFVQRFESRARDVVTSSGGRVVKTIGDAVLFVADDIATGAEVSLGLSETFEQAEEGTPVRVGWVWGRVLSRFGDVFGRPVNLAARLTDEAPPGWVLVDQVTAAALEPAGFGLTELPEREVAGLGRMRPVRLQRPGA